MANKNSNKSNIGFWVFAVFFFIAVYLTIREIMALAESISPVIFESYAAILGSVITVGAMAVMIRLQSKHEKEKEFAGKVFEKKIELYSSLIDTIFRMDDDNVLTKQEIQEVENQIGGACLVASEELVSILSQFMYQLKVYGVLYVRSMNEAQFAHFSAFVEEEKAKPDARDSYLAATKFSLDRPVRGNESEYFISLDNFIQGIREDLAVVEGDVQHNLESFIRTQFDKHQMMQRPNVVDAEPYSEAVETVK